MRLCLDRLSNDGQARYQHPVLIVETFVNPEPFCGTADSASGWQELGTTDGFGRVRRDFYVAYPKPKRLFARELCKNARRHLQADRLQPSLAAVEARTPPRCTQRVAEIRALLEQLKDLPDYRTRLGRYPLWTLLAIVVGAHLCEAPRGQKDLVKLAKGMSQGQRRALGVHRPRDGTYPAPSQPTFCRFLQGVDADALEALLLRVLGMLRRFSVSMGMALAESAAQAAPEEHDRFLDRDGRRRSSLRPLRPAFPPSHLPNPFMNTPCGDGGRA